MTYNLNNIKTLLSNGFDEGELRDFCLYEPAFRPVFDQLPQYSGDKRKIIRLLIGYATRKGLEETLLQWAEEANPVIYAENQPYYEQDVVLPASELVQVRFVTAAMTDQEVNALVTGAVFDDPAVAAAERKQFQTLQNILLQHNIDNLLAPYAAHRDAWRPPFHQGQSIKETVLDITDRVNNEYYDVPGAAQIQPHFISEDFFSPDPETRLNSWQLAHSGCIIVADAVSLFHPWLQKMLLQSGLSSHEEIALLVLSPINFSQLPLNRLIEKKIMEQTLRRFDRELSRLSEFGAGDLRVLRRWLFSTLPEIVSRRKQANPENRDALRRRMGKQPRGMAPLNW